MATSTYGTPYVQGSDLVSAYPTVSSSLATRVDEVSYKGNGLNAQTGTTYTLVAGDAGKTITLSNASPVAVTLPQDSTADLPDGAVVTFYNLGAGAVTISQGTGATLQGGSITLAQYEVTTVIKLSANTYGRFDSGSAGLNIATPTSIANSGGSASLSGNKVAFAAVNSVSLNGCFTTTYNVFVVVIRNTISTSSDMKLRLRLAGTDASGANYTWQFFRAATTTVTGGQGASQTEHLLGPGNASEFWSHTTIYDPAQAVNTNFRTDYASTATQVGAVSSQHAVATAYDGFSIFAGSGTITGDAYVYGYRK